MPAYIEFIETLHHYQHLCMIDVRSPKEFAKGHIPGAKNIPLFSDEERAVVGTNYKQRSKYEAVLSGLQFVGPKLKTFVEQAKELAVDNQLVLYCWRGGMRSNSMAWLFETAGFKVYLLKGGYKSYRQFNKNLFFEAKKLYVIGGPTGSGKTALLKALEKNGEQVVDLEGIAHHKGSAFGSIGESNQLPNEQFENELFQVWNKFDLTKPIWIEDESRSIGSNWIPEELYERMRKTRLFYLDIDKTFRINLLVNDYANVDDVKIREGIRKIKKRLGDEPTNLALNALEEKNYRLVAEIALKYYDKTYAYGLSKRDPSSIVKITVSEFNLQEILNLLHLKIYA